MESESVFFVAQLKKGLLRCGWKGANSGAVWGGIYKKIAFEMES